MTTKQPIFVLTKHKYESYTDLIRLIELAGYPTCYPDDIKPRSKNTYILPISNGELPTDGWSKPTARIIRWLFEWGIEEKRNGVAEYWCPDAWNAAQNDARYVPLGGDARLNEQSYPPNENVALSEAGKPPKRDALKELPRDLDKRGMWYKNEWYNIDIAFPAYLTNRRMWVRDRLIERGVKFNNVPDDLPAAATSWGAERNAAYNAARLAWHIHQDADKPALPPLRLVMAAAYRLPFLSESVPDQGVFRGLIVTEDYADMVERVPYWLSQDLTGYADALARYLNEEYTFAHSVESNL